MPVQGRSQKGDMGVCPAFVVRKFSLDQRDWQ